MSNTPEHVMQAARRALDCVRSYNEGSGSSVRYPLPEVVAIAIEEELRSGSAGEDAQVGAALAELRETFPGDHDPHIQVYVWFKPEGYRGAISQHGASLSEAMQKVREWKESKQ